jgi:hypothetical protein
VDIAGLSPIWQAPKRPKGTPRRSPSPSARSSWSSTLGLPVPARGLGLRGGARFALGDAGGLDDTRRALEAALGQGLGRETAVLYGNLAEDLGRAEGPRARLELARLGAAFTQRRGIAEWMQPLGGLGAGAG